MCCFRINLHLKRRYFHIKCRHDCDRWVRLLLSAPLVDVSSLSNENIVKKTRWRPFRWTRVWHYWKIVGFEIFSKGSTFFTAQFLKNLDLSFKTFNPFLFSACMSVERLNTLKNPASAIVSLSVIVYISAQQEVSPHNATRENTWFLFYRRKQKF